MTKVTALDQAESYLAYESKHDFIEREAIFRAWCRSKDFSCAECAAIVAALLGMGVKVRRAA